MKYTHNKVSYSKLFERIYEAKEEQLEDDLLEDTYDDVEDEDKLSLEASREESKLSKEHTTKEPALGGKVPSTKEGWKMGDNQYHYDGNRRLFNIDVDEMEDDSRVFSGFKKSEDYTSKGIPQWNAFMSYNDSTNTYNSTETIFEFPDSKDYQTDSSGITGIIASMPIVEPLLDIVEERLTKEANQSRKAADRLDTFKSLRKSKPLSIFKSPFWVTRDDVVEFTHANLYKVLSLESNKNSEALGLYDNKFYDYFKTSEKEDQLPNFIINARSLKGMFSPKKIISAAVEKLSKSNLQATLNSFSSVARINCAGTYGAVARYNNIYRIANRNSKANNRMIYCSNLCLRSLSMREGSTSVCNSLAQGVAAANSTIKSFGNWINSFLTLFLKPRAPIYANEQYGVNNLLDTFPFAESPQGRTHVFHPYVQLNILMRNASPEQRKMLAPEDGLFPSNVYETYLTESGDSYVESLDLFSSTKRLIGILWHMKFLLPILTGDAKVQKSSLSNSSRVRDYFRDVKQSAGSWVKLAYCLNIFHVWKEVIDTCENQFSSKFTDMVSNDPAPSFLPDSPIAIGDNLSTGYSTGRYKNKVSTPLPDDDDDDLMPSYVSDDEDYF